MKKILIGLVVLWFVAIIAVLAPMIASKPSEVQPTKNIAPAQAKPIVPPTSNEVEAEINKYRASQQLATFNSEVPALDQAAQVRAEGMCATNDWSHSQDWVVLAPYYAYAAAGENLYYGYLQKDQASAAMQAWIASPSHHEALVNSYTEIGVGVKYCPGFQGEPTAVIITNYFGVPR